MVNIKGRRSAWREHQECPIRLLRFIESRAPSAGMPSQSACTLALRAGRHRPNRPAWRCRDPQPNAHSQHTWGSCVCVLRSMVPAGAKPQLGRQRNSAQLRGLGEAWARSGCAAQPRPRSCRPAKAFPFGDKSACSMQVWAFSGLNYVFDRSVFSQKSQVFRFVSAQINQKKRRQCDSKVYMILWYICMTICGNVEIDWDQPTRAVVRCKLNQIRGLCVAPFWRGLFLTPPYTTVLARVR